MAELFGIKKLSLTCFRNHINREFDFDYKSTIIYGDNGTGKTSIIEAISLLSFTRGLRGSLLEELIHDGSSSSEITGLVKSNLGIAEIKTSLYFNSDSKSYKKKIYIDNNSLKNQIDLDRYISCLWLIPQMDNFFLQDNSAKRKFIDKMVYIAEPSHATHINSYEKLIKERQKALQIGATSQWLNLIEEQISQQAVAITASRVTFIDKLNTYLKISTKYPMELILQGTTEDMLKEDTYALKVENRLKEQYAQNRKKDILTGTTSLGPHKTKMICINYNNNQLADNCST